MNNIRKLLILPLFCTVLTSLSARNEAGWSFNFGLSYGVTHSVQKGVNASSLSGFNGGFVPTGTRIPAEIGNTNSVGNRTYLDGFVGLNRVGNTLVTTDNNPVTTHWGYQTTSQIVGDQLIFSAQGEETTRLSAEYRRLDNRVFSQDRHRNAIPVVEIGRHWQIGEQGSTLGLIGGFSWFSDTSSIRSAQLMDYSQEIQIAQATVTDRYDITGILMPSAPYQGPESPPGPVIDNLPIDREVDDQILDTVSRYFIGTANLHSRIRNNQTSIGFRFGWPGQQPEIREGGLGSKRGFNLRFAGIEADAGLLMNRLRITGEETIRVAETDGSGLILDINHDSWTKHLDKNRTMVGGYVGANGQIALDREFSRFFNLGLRYEDGGTHTFAWGDSWARVRLSGWRFRSSIELRF